MKRKLIGLFITAVLLLVSSLAISEPLKQTEDYSGIVVISYDEMDPSAGSFTFKYCYPCIDDAEPDAYIVNSFYREQIEMDETNMQFFADGYAGTGQSVVKDISYRVTCNNDQYFSLLMTQELKIGEEIRISWEGNTFSRKSGGIGITIDLPRLLGILDEDEQDEYLIDRQSEKAAEIVLDIILGRILDNPDGLPYFDDIITYDYLYDTVFPHEDFYLETNGNPVFFVNPGIVADESEGFILFPISLEDILDEL